MKSELNNVERIKQLDMVAVDERSFKNMTKKKGREKKLLSKNDT